MVLVGQKSISNASWTSAKPSESHCILYLFPIPVYAPKGRFVKFQDIRTEGAMACEAFVIANQTYVVFSNYHNAQKRFKVESVVYRWSGGHFVRHQSLPTSGAQGMHYFEVSGHSFLAVANQYTGSKYNIDSHLYKWDGTKFVLFQSVPSRGATDWKSFVINGEVFLVLANTVGDSQGRYVSSVVYKASGAQFVKYQELDTTGAYGVCSFVYRGETYVAVANHYSNQYNLNSNIYKWVWVKTFYALKSNEAKKCYTPFVDRQYRTL